IRAARSDGSRRATPPSTRCSPTPSTRALTSMAEPATRSSNATGERKRRVRHLPRAEWQVLIPEHHPGFIDWQTYEANQERIAKNTRPGPHKVGGAVREGSALLQSLASCGHCGRRLHTHYRGRSSAPGYYCDGRDVANGRGLYCLTVGGVAIDQA